MGKAPFKVGIVGCGRVAGRMDRPRNDGFIATHAQAYYRHSGFVVTAAVSSTPEHLRAFQNTWEVPQGYTSLPEMLNGEPLDVISLCSPNERHALQLAQILESAKCPRVIFAEKPVCLSRQEGEQLKNAVERSKCLVVVNHSRRFDPGHIRLMQHIQNRELGELLWGRCDYYGGWLNNGCHVIDTLRMLFNEPLKIESVQEGPSGKLNDPCLNVRLRTGGASIDIVGFDEKYYQLYESEFRFERGRVIIRDFGSEIIIEKVETNDRGERVLRPLPDSPWPGLDSPLYHAVAAISDFLETGTIPAGRGILFDEAIGTMNILWAAIEYLGRGRKS